MSKHLMQVDATYKDWLQSLGQRWQRSQIKAAVKVNSELLRFNWALGRDIAARRMEARYGSGFYQRLSRDLQQLLPGARSFSVNNLRYMRHFYEMYPSAHGGLAHTTSYNKRATDVPQRTRGTVTSWRGFGRKRPTACWQCTSKFPATCWRFGTG